MTEKTVALIAFAWLGLSVGSFLNVTIHRLPRRTSVVRPPPLQTAVTSSLVRQHPGPQLEALRTLPEMRNRDQPQCPGRRILTMLVFLLLVGVRLTLLMIPTAYVCPHRSSRSTRAPPAAGRITLPGIATGYPQASFPYRRPRGVLGGASSGRRRAYYRYSGQEGMGAALKMLAMVGAFDGLVLVTLVLSSVMDR